MSDPASSAAEVGRGRTLPLALRHSEEAFAAGAASPAPRPRFDGGRRFPAGSVLTRMTASGDPHADASTTKHDRRPTPPWRRGD